MTLHEALYGLCMRAGRGQAATKQETNKMKPPLSLTMAEFVLFIVFLRRKASGHVHVQLRQREGILEFARLTRIVN